MKNIIVFDTAIGTSNVGDEVILDAINRNMADVFSQGFALRLATHVNNFSWLQILRNNKKVQFYRNADWKFICGTNLIAQTRVGKINPQWQLHLSNLPVYRNCILIGAGTTKQTEQLDFLASYKKAGATGWSIWNNHTTATTSAAANSSWDGMQVYCVVTDGNGNSVSSDAATITIGETLVITSQPEDVTVQTGKIATFTVEASGTDLSYQWYYKKAGATGWSIWNNHTTATTSAAANSSWDGMQVYCVVTNGNGNSVSSDPATITLNG